MAEPWVLLIEPGVEATRKVAGLELALRLALNAQAAGAIGVVAQDAAVASLLTGDRRLALPILAEPPNACRVIAVRANMVVHRDYFKALLQHADAADRAPVPFVLEVPFDFEFYAPYGFDPVEVVDRETSRAAERRLFRALRKPEDGWTSRYLNRYISLAISRWLVRTPLTPNTVSIAILGVGLGGAWLGARGDAASLILGALLFQAQSVLDGCDGEMSRVTYRGSLAGQWLDTIGDDLTNYSFFAAAGWGLFQHTGSSLYLAAALTTVLAGALASGLEYRYLIKIGSGDLLRYPLTEGSPSSGLGKALQPLFKRDTFVFLTLVAAVLGQTGPMLVIFAVAAVFVLGNVIRAELRMAKEREAPMPGIRA